MSNAKVQILGTDGEKLCSKVPKIAGVHPFGSKILVEIPNGDELIDSNLILRKDSQVEGAPQAYIIEIGPGLDEKSGLKVGQRIYWSGRGAEVKDPRSVNGRVRAFLEVNNILGIIEEVK